MKTSKRVISLVLTAIMVLTTFVVAVPMLLVESDAATTIDGVTQERVVNDYATIYDNYAAQYLSGASTPTNIVIPGLNPAQDYVIQGMTYYPERDWMLVTAYHNVDTDAGETTQSSKIFALDAATGEFAAMFSFINVNGTENTDHGGGIAVSEHNIYYSCGDKDRKIAYAPLSALKDAPLGQHTKIQLVAEADFVEVGSISSDNKTAYTAYVCYDEGVLWLGNFFDKGADLVGITIAAAEYNAPSNKKYNSMVFGYKLAGNSSAEEWDYLIGKFRNLLSVTTASGTGTKNDSTCTWNAYQNGNEVSINGNITAPTAYVGEFTGSFGSFTLTEGVKYTIEFTSTNNKSDLYMFAPNSGGHCNVKQSSQTTITQLEDGRYHYVMNFTAGLKPAGADSTWPTTQSTSGTYTGTYTVRFDQDAIQVGETREFAITDIKISQQNTYANADKNVYDEGSKGSPSYALGLNNALKDVQYATVDNGKLYLSRSYGSGAGNSINFGFGDSSYLTVADIDLSQPGTVPVDIATTTTGTLDKIVMAHDISDYDDFPMMPMSEGLCVIDNNIFITFEGASNKYRNESSGITSIGNCEKPVDVIWQLDPYELMETTIAESEESIYYEKVNSLSEIKDGEEYIIVHESQRKDPVTQKNYLYALNADGNFKDYKLSKSTAEAIKGYNGMIGHPISYYSIENIDGKEILYLENPEIDDIEAVRWEISKQPDGSYRFKNAETYFANCNYLFFNNEKISMMPGNSGYLSQITIQESNNGKGGYWFSNQQVNFLWCNDGTTPIYNQKINSYYITNSGSTPMYSGVSEVPGTMHCDALNWGGTPNILGGPIITGAETFYEDGIFYIYRRVVDEVASTRESRVYTDLSAELQADGTYEVTLETYATSPTHYQYTGERPTDYIIVADTSSSMANAGGTGMQSWNGSLCVESLSVEKNTEKPDAAGVVGYGFSNPNEDIYLKHTDGKYYKVYMGINNTEKNIRQKYYVYYVADDGLYYCVENHALQKDANGNLIGKTHSEWKAWIESGTNESDYSTKSNNNTGLFGSAGRRDEDVYVGEHYRFDDISSSYSDEHKCIDTLKTVASDLVDDIYAQNSNNRIALVQYGGSNGFYNTSGTLTTTDYANAFWSSGSASTLKSKISSLGTSAQSDNNGIEMLYANNIVASSGQNYKAGENRRNVAIILITDGIPGQDGGSSTTAAANAAIQKALTAKNNGAFIYTVLIGKNSATNFNKKAYMDGVSSKYAAAESVDSLGGMSVDGVTYSMSLADTTINNYLDFGGITTEEVKINSSVGLDNLDANSYLREQLSDAFKFPEDGSYSVKVDLITGAYDEIGRFSFKDSDAEIAANATDAAKIVCNTDVANKTITVTNYHYAEEYIAKNRQTDGRKLRVTISGLLADETKQIRNTSINNTETTGLYKTKGNMDNNVEFRMLPTSYFNIPEYTYVLDYGLQMYDNDVNGTLMSVSANLKAQRDANGNISYKPVSENGLVAITNGNQDLIYTTTPDNNAESGYCLIQRDDGTYDWFEIKVVPASNVLFEESHLTNGKAGAVEWSADGEPINVQQALTNDATDIYGFDNVYATTTHNHSNGSASKATVSSSAKRSTTKTFDFVGKGFDLMSACGPNTGIVIVKVSGGGLTKAKSYIVDTFYNGELKNSNGLLCQAPIVSFNNAYGEYTVEATATYLSTAQGLKSKVTGATSKGKLEGTKGVPVNDAEIAAMLAELGMEDIANTDIELVWFDDNSILNGGTGAKGNVKTSRDGTTTKSLDCYLDGFRIYNPLGDDSSAYKDSEKGATYYNVIEHLQQNGTTSSDINKIAYVVGQLSGDENGNAPALSFGNYQNVGPQNELYLKNGASEGLVFKVALNTTDSRVQLGLRAVTGSAKVTVGSGDKASTFDVIGATEQYYDITNCIVDNGDGTATITIQNAGTTVLAVNNVKVTGEATVAAFEENELEYAAMMMAAPAERVDVVNGVVNPIVPEEPVIPDNGGDDTTGDDTTTPDGGDDNTSGDNSGTTESGSFLEQLIAMIIEIIMSLFNFLPVGEVM